MFLQGCLECRNETEIKQFIQQCSQSPHEAIYRSDQDRKTARNLRRRELIRENRERLSKLDEAVEPNQ